MHVALCLFGLGCVAYDQGELRQAEQFQREAMAILQQQRLESLMANTLGQLGRVLVASGEHRHAEARQHFRQALELSTKHQLAPVALDVCVGVARLLATAEKTEQAVECLTLAEQHEASTFETRKNARQLLRELIDQLQSETARAAQTRGQSVGLWAGARLLLAELAEDQQ